MGKVQQEIDTLLSHLSKGNQMSVAEAMTLLGVSESTARRLFSSIAEMGLTRRTRGGITFAPPEKVEYTYEAHQILQSDKKEAIAESVADLVENNDSIYLDWGTTCYYVSQALVRRMKLKQIQNLTVFTNALTNINLLYPYCEVISLGGRYREERKDFAGYLAEESLKRLHFKKCFICADGFCPSMGFTTYDFESARADELIIQNTTSPFLLMDSSKFSLVATANCTGNTMLDALITETQPPADTQQSILRFVRRIIVADRANLP